MAPLKRLGVALADLFLMLLPVMGGLVAAGAVLFFWPGTIAGGLCLLAIGWWCSKHVARLGSEHRH